MRWIKRLTCLSPVVLCLCLLVCALSSVPDSMIGRSGSEGNPAILQSGKTEQVHSNSDWCRAKWIAMLKRPTDWSAWTSHGKARMSATQRPEEAGQKSRETG